MNSKHGLWWQAYCAALTGAAADASTASDTDDLHCRFLVAAALADKGVAELERRIADDAATEEPAKKETDTERRAREQRQAEERERTLHWSSGG